MLGSIVWLTCLTRVWSILYSRSLVSPTSSDYPWRVATHTCISLVAVEIQLIGARRRHHGWMLLDGPDPLGPSTALFWLRPATIRSQNLCQAYDPGRHLHIDKAHLLTQEKRPHVVSSFDKLRDLRLELFGSGHLIFGILGLEVAVKGRDNVTIDMVGPET